MEIKRMMTLDKWERPPAGREDTLALIGEGGEIVARLLSGVPQLLTLREEKSKIEARYFPILLLHEWRRVDRAMETSNFMYLMGGVGSLWLAMQHGILPPERMRGEWYEMIDEEEDGGGLPRPLFLNGVVNLFESKEVPEKESLIRGRAILREILQERGIIITPPMGYSSHKANNVLHALRENVRRNT